MRLFHYKPNRTCFTRCASRRRGVYVIGLLWFLMLGLMFAALTLNWAYLATAQRNLQERADAIALAAAPDLLDEGQLAGLLADQSDDVADAEATADQYRMLNNEAAPAALQVAAADLVVTPGHLDDPTLPPDQANFIAASPFDTVRIDILRTANTGHPIDQLLQGFGQAVGIDVTATSYARLDNQVVGFRPTASTAAPVVPVAISTVAWSAPRIDDSNGNSIPELTIRVAITPAGLPTANGAVAGFDGAVDAMQVTNQVVDGVGQADLPGPDHSLGAIFSTTPQDVAAQPQISSSFADDLVLAFTGIADPANAACRAFPLYDAANSPGGQARLVGFVAARVLAVSRDADQLQIVLEPCYLIHTTVWTDNTVTEFNPYIHKLLLVR